MCQAVLKYNIVQQQITHPSNIERPVCDIDAYLFTFNVIIIFVLSNLVVIDGASHIVSIVCASGNNSIKLAYHYFITNNR